MKKFLIVALLWIAGVVYSVYELEQLRQPWYEGE